jgi:hypothetical protein
MVLQGKFPECFLNLILRYTTFEPESFVWALGGLEREHDQQETNKDAFHHFECYIYSLFDRSLVLSMKFILDNRPLTRRHVTLVRLDGWFIGHAHLGVKFLRQGVLHV